MQCQLVLASMVVRLGGEQGREVVEDDLKTSHALWDI